MIIDLIIIIVILIFAILGKVRGFTSMVLSFFSIAISIVLAFMLYKPVKTFIIEKTDIDDGIKIKIVKNLSSQEENKDEDYLKNSNSSNENITNNQIKITNTINQMSNNSINSTNKTNEKKSIFSNTMDKYITDTKNQVKEKRDDFIEETADDITDNIMNVISFVIVFILTKIILMILKGITNIITKLPIISQIDSAGGLILGIVEGIVIVYIIFAIISALSPSIKNTTFLSDIQDSYIGSSMYNNNLLINYFFDENNK